MMNRLLLPTIALLVLFCAVPVLAQKPFRFTVQMGPSLPLDKFKSVDIQASDAGFALRGFSMNIDGDYTLNSRIFLSGRLLLSTFPVDEPKYNAKLDQDIKAYLPDSASAAHYNPGYWLWTSPLLGAKFNYPLKLNQTWVEVAAYTGIQLTQLPDQSMLVHDEAQKRRIITENTDSYVLSSPLMVDAGFRFRISDQTQLNLKASYYRSSASYNHISYIIKDQEAEIGQTIKSVQQHIPINTLSFTIGFTYLL